MDMVNTTTTANLSNPYNTYEADIPVSFLLLLLGLFAIIYYIFYLWQSSKMSRSHGNGGICDTYDEFKNARLCVYVFQFCALIFIYGNIISTFAISWSILDEHSTCNVVMTAADITWHLSKGFIFLSLISRARMLTAGTEYEIPRLRTKILAFAVLTYMTFTTFCNGFELHAIHTFKTFTTDYELRTFGSTKSYRVCGEQIQLWVGILYISFEIILCALTTALYLFSLTQMIIYPVNQKLIDLFVKYAIFGGYMMVNIMIFTAIWITNTFSIFRYFDSFLNLIFIFLMLTKCNGLYLTVCGCPHKCFRTYFINKMTKLKKNNIERLRKIEKHRKVTKIRKYQKLSLKKNKDPGIFTKLTNSFKSFKQQTSNSSKNIDINYSNPYNTIKGSNLNSLKSNYVDEIKEDQPMIFNPKKKESSTSVNVNGTGKIALSNSFSDGLLAGNSNTMNYKKAIKSSTFGGAQIDDTQKLPLSDLDKSQVLELLNENLAIDVKDLRKGAKREDYEMKNMLKNLKILIDDKNIVLPAYSPCAIKNIGITITTEEKKDINEKVRTLKLETQQDKLITKYEVDDDMDIQFQDEPRQELSWPGPSRKFGQINKLNGLSKCIRNLQENDFSALWNLFDKNDTKYIDTQMTLPRILGSLFLIYWKERNVLNDTHKNPPKWKEIKPLMDLLATYISLELPEKKKFRMFRADFINNISRYFLSAVERREKYLRKRTKQLQYSDDDSDISIVTAGIVNNNNTYDAIDDDNGDNKIDISDDDDNKIIEEEPIITKMDIIVDKPKNNNNSMNNIKIATENDLLSIGAIHNNEDKQKDKDKNILRDFKKEFEMQQTNNVGSNNNNETETKHNYNNETLVIKASSDFNTGHNKHNDTVVVTKSSDFKNNPNHNTNGTPVINDDVKDGGNYTMIVKESSNIAYNNIDIVIANKTHAQNDSIVFDEPVYYKHNNNNNESMGIVHGPSDTTVINLENIRTESPKGNEKLRKLFNVDEATSSSEDDSK